jgi:protein TonB
VEPGPIPVTGDVVAPVKVHTPQPRYPEAARRLRLEAAVMLRAVIDRQGGVVDLEVVKAAPFGLTEAALGAVQRWRFEPARLHGEPVAVFLYLTVDFRLR